MSRLRRFHKSVAVPPDAARRESPVDEPQWNVVRSGPIAGAQIYVAPVVGFRGFISGDMDSFMWSFCEQFDLRGQVGK